MAKKKRTVRSSNPRSGSGRPAVQYTSSIGTQGHGPPPPSSSDDLSISGQVVNESDFAKAGIANVRGLIKDGDSGPPSGESIASDRAKDLAAKKDYSLGVFSDEEGTYNPRKGRSAPGRIKIGKSKSKRVFVPFDKVAWALLPDFFDRLVSTLVRLVSLSDIPCLTVTKEK